MAYFSLSVACGQRQLTDARQKRVEVDDWLHIPERHSKAESLLSVPGDKFLHHFL